MKKIVIYCGVMLFTLIAFANQPKRVPSKITELRTKGWYADLAREWKNYLASSNEEEAWVQYMLATKYAGADAETLEGIQSDIESQFAHSFGSSYASFLRNGWSAQGVADLKEALVIQPGNPATFEAQVVLAELEASDRVAMSGQLFRSGQIHTSTLNYCYNLLMSVAEGGLLITDGVHLTVPIWVLQDEMNVRRDVTIVNLELARSQTTYLEAVLAAKEMNVSAQELMDGSNGDKVYYALTLPRELLNDKEENLYIVGLASTSAGEDFKHFETLKENIENKFLLDYLTVDFNGEPKAATGQVLATNYIVPLLLLKEFYDELNNEKRSGELQSQIMAIAKDTQMQSRVASLLKTPSSPVEYETVEIDLKSLERNMMQVKGALYASQFELTNREFWFFMEYLRTKNYTTTYNEAIPDLTKYDELNQTLLGRYLYSPVNVQALKAKRRGGDYLDYPALELTYETAKVYCEWLTSQYNNQEKRKFKKVKFRLPTREEWTMSALGYKDFQSWHLNQNEIKAKETEGKADIHPYDLSEHTILYPWGLKAWNLRNSVYNIHDCYLANVKSNDQITCPAGIKGDGWSFTAPVGSYFKNDLGLYDVIGNIAEMIDEPGVAMGGSWNNVPEESTIVSAQSFEGSDMKIGMRLFMEVIEL